MEMPGEIGTCNDDDKRKCGKRGDQKVDDDKVGTVRSEVVGQFGW